MNRSFPANSSIAMIVKGTMNMLFADLVEKLQTLLREADQDTAVYYLDEDANEVAYACKLCRERKPLGIIFLGGDLGKRVPEDISVVGYDGIVIGK